MENFKMTADSFYPACIEMLISISATQTATSYMLIDYIESKGGNADEIEKKFNDDFDQSRNEIMARLFEKFGSIDLKDILGKGKY